MIPNSHYKMQKMQYSQDTLVTSSQEDSGHLSSLILEPCQVTKGKNNMNPHLNNMNPHLKMVAKVFPWTVRGKDTTEAEAEDDVILDKVLAKKQAFPWFSKFNVLLRDAFGKQNYNQLDSLMDLFIRYVTKDVKCCYKKPNRAKKLKTKMIEYFRIFHTMYSEVKQPTEYDHYAEKMSHLLSMYLDMEIKASRRHKESPRAIALRLTSILFILLGHSKTHILDAIMKAKFFVKSYSDICVPIIMAVVNDIPAELDEVAYIHYILLFKKWKMLVRKEERPDINRKAALKLCPPLGFAEGYDSDKYSSKQLQGMAQGTGDLFTLMLMHDPELSVKNNSKGYCDETDSVDEAKDKNSKNQDFDNKATDLGEEYTVTYEEENTKVKKRTAVIMQETWEHLLDMHPEDYDDHHEEDLFSILEEEDFIEYLTRQQKEGERKLHKAAAAKVAFKEKKNKMDDNTVSPVCALNSSPKRSPECFGFSTPKTNTITSQAEPIVRAQNDIPQMEADSQSQDDISVVYNFDDISQRIKVEPEDDEEIVTNDTTAPPVLKAVVRPESIEYNQCNSTNVDRLRLGEVEDGFPGFSSSPENSVGKEGSEEVSSEERVLEDKASSSVCSVETNQPTSAKGSNQDDPLLEEFPKYSPSQQNGFFSMDGDGQNYFSEILDPNGDILFSNEGTNENNLSMSYWPSQDFFLGQYEDGVGVFTHYENGGMNQFPDFYNDQQDLVFTEANLVSPPMMDMIRDEPVEYQLSTTHWDDLSTMVGDTAPAGERFSSPEAHDGPIVVFMDKPKKKSKGKKAGSKNNAKTSPKKGKSIFDPDPEPLTERKCKLKAVEAEEESRRLRQPPWRKRGRQQEDEVEEILLEEEDGLELEPQPKKTKGRQKKQPAPSASPLSPPPTNSRKPRGGSQAQGVTRKKAQSRRRK